MERVLIWRKRPNLLAKETPCIEELLPIVRLQRQHQEPHIAKNLEDHLTGLLFPKGSIGLTEPGESSPEKCRLKLRQLAQLGHPWKVMENLAWKLLELEVMPKPALSFCKRYTYTRGKGDEIIRVLHRLRQLIRPPFLDEIPPEFAIMADRDFYGPMKIEA